MKEVERRFTVTGGFNIATTLKPKEDAQGNVVGYVTKSGKTARLVVALEVEDTDGNVSYITSEKEMCDLGFCGLAYDRLDFEGE